MDIKLGWLPGKSRQVLIFKTRPCLLTRHMCQLLENVVIVLIQLPVFN